MRSNGIKALSIMCVILGFLACMVLVFPDIAAAEEGSGSGRKIWDTVMLWVNFGILVFFFMKYARKPLMNVLKSARSRILKDIDEVNGNLDHAKSLVDEESEKLKDTDTYVQELRQAILELGEKDKENIIQEGKLTAEKMVQSAEAYAEYRLAMARKALANEMVDIAVGMAEERIMKSITDQDHDNLMNQFITSLAAGKHIEK